METGLFYSTNSVTYNCRLTHFLLEEVVFKSEGHFVITANIYTLRTHVFKGSHGKKSWELIIE